jgi:hypothetical protein
MNIFHHDGRVLSFDSAGKTVHARFTPMPTPPCPTCGHAPPDTPQGLLSFSRHGDPEQQLTGPLAATLYNRLCDLVGK